jgi:putative hemolysin
LNRSKTMFENIFIVLAVVCCVMLGGLFSGSETGLYQLSRIRLRLGVEKKQFSFIILSRCLRDSSGFLLSLLIGNNFVNYLATSLVTSSFLSRFGAEYEHRAELFATLLMVPILFIFSELIPKNIFLYRADVLTPYFSPIFYAFYKPLNFSGILPVLKFISSFFARLMGLAAASKTVIASAQRQKVQAILQDTHEEGFLSPVQSEIVNRLVGISHVHLGSVMIPIHNVETVDVNSDHSALLNKLNKCAFTRLPVIKGRAGNIIGFVNIYEVLNSSEEFNDLHNLTKPIRKLDADMAVIDATNIMQKENHKIILVTRAGRFGGQKPVGIVTMKDLVEELLGELAEW